MRINRKFSAENIRYLHVNNEPGTMGAEDETGHDRGGALRRVKGWRRTRAETSLVSAPPRRDNLSCMKCRRLAILARLFLSTPSLGPFLRYPPVSHIICRSFSRVIHLPRFNPARSNRQPFKSREFLQIKGTRKVPESN